MIWPHGYWKIQPADGPAGDSGPENDGRIDRTVAERLVGVFHRIVRLVETQDVGDGAVRHDPHGLALIQANLDLRDSR